MTNKIEQLRFVIDRFDHYYDGVNTKSTFFIGLNTFFGGGIVTAYYELVKNGHILFDRVEILLFSVPIIFGFLSSILILLAINPFLKSGNTGKKYNSLIFFGSIASISLKQFEDDVGKQNDDSLLIDLTKQTHQLSIGLHKKFRFLKLATILVLIEFLSLAPLIIIIFNKL